ncbi:flagellar basal body-associated protein FliL [Anoxybacillus tepidamans]|uniref:Flagellar basal body-associated protein FliL n=1 Tax=Anoxybacteroides tepidamans TaxID=265948 RepID=A0A7W8MWD2_9BACL|nr:MULTISPECIES: YtzI protein [Anoxybacillus]MBB5326264.1 flagellar basal body-associated protein FliL [Anoxybacillus tepidamans]MCZ0755211.1 YtzI protein [Anoxybacillus sp. J5B_2022]
MFTILVISLIIIIVVLVLAVATTSKAYQYKHTVDPIDNNPHLSETEQKEKE